MEILRASDDGQGCQSVPFFDGHPQLAITALKPALRDTRRVNIFIDDKYSFSLDLAQVADYHLKVGQVLTPEQLEELQHASDFGKLYQRTLEYVFSRPHSIKEVRDHLKRKQYTRQLQAKRYAEFQAKLASDPAFKQQVKDARAAAKLRRENYHDFTENNENEYGAKSQRRYPTKPAAPISDRDIDQVVAKLIDRGYLDDANFARYFVENRHVNKGVSTKKLRLDLRQRGINDDLIDQVLAASPRDQRQEIQKIIQKKRRRGYDDQKLTQYLLRQGFDYELVRATLAADL